MKYATLIFVLLTGCSYIAGEEIEYAKEACSTHKGLKQMSKWIPSSPATAECEDGVKIDFRINEIKK